MISTRNYFGAVFKTSLFWVLCVTLIEIFQMTTSASVHFLAPFDVLYITIGLFISYLILWGCFLFFIAFVLNSFWKEKSGSKENIASFYWCIALFSYEIFWILFKLRSEKLYSSLYGLTFTLILVISASLSAYAIYKITEKLARKGHLKQIVHKVIALGISLIAFMMTFVYIKSLTKDGHLNVFYSIFLLLLFLGISRFIYFILKRIASIFTRNNLTMSNKKTTLIQLLTIFFLFSAILFYFVLPSSANKNNKDVTQKPNIIFISIDTLRADHVSIYNEIRKETTPNIDRIAKDGYTFKRAYAPTSWTLPSHASMFTGLFPSSHGADRSINQSVSHPVNPLARSNVTLAEVLGDNGYLTAGFISVPYLSSSFGMNQGFQYYDERIDLFENVKLIYANQYTMLFNLLRLFKIIETVDYDGERGAPEINRNALKWLEKNKDKNNPFFLFLHYFEPHFIYKPPKPYNLSEDGRNLEYFTEIDVLNRGLFSLSSYGLNDLISLYDGEIRYLDHQLELLFKKLDQWNLLDNTFLIITSDHGESFNEHEIWTHGNRLYEDQIRVPLIVHYPKLITAGHMDTEHIVQLIDLMPSILDVCQIAIPKNIQGRSFLPILKGEKDSRFNFAFAELRPDITWKSKNRRLGDGIKAVINREWKYISYENGKEELFNLNIDPKEEMNMAFSNRKEVKEMKKLLDLWSNSVSRQNKGKTDQIDSRRLEQLRSLGYIK